MSSRIHISAVIPVYNSEQSLPILIQQLITYFTSKKVTYEIILVNDNSTDKSWEVITQLKCENIHIKGINLEKNVGQFQATLIGIKESKGELVLNMDDDLEHPVSEIEKMYKIISQNSQIDIVFGMDKEKYSKKGQYSYFSNLRNIVLNGILNKYPTDSFRIFRRSIVFDGDKWLLNNTYMLDIFLGKKIPENRVAYVDVLFGYRQYGKSGLTKMRKIRLGLKYVYSAWTFKR